jgi:hypothetical protein
MKDQEHDAQFGERGARPLGAAALDLKGVADGAVDVLRRLQKRDDDWDALRRDVGYSMESMKSRYQAFGTAMRAMLPGFTAAHTSSEFDFGY